MPPCAIDGFNQALIEDYANKLDEEGKEDLQRVRAACQRMGDLIDDMLALVRFTRAPLHRSLLDLSAIAREIVAELQRTNPERKVHFLTADQLIADCDPVLIRVVLQNLLDNAWKFTSRHDHAKIEFGSLELDGETAFFVRDDGAGFDMTYVGKLFGAFQRLHPITEFEGTGIGLATVQRVINRHGGRTWRRIRRARRNLLFHVNANGK